MGGLFGVIGCVREPRAPQGKSDRSFWHRPERLDRGAGCSSRRGLRTQLHFLREIERKLTVSFRKLPASFC